MGNRGGKKRSAAGRRRLCFQCGACRGRCRVRSELAQSLLYLKHDLSEEAGRLGYFSSMDDLPVGYPDATAALSERMADSAFADTLCGEFLTFLNDCAENRGLLRFHYHRMDELWQGLKDISAEHRVYPEGPAGFAGGRALLPRTKSAKRLPAEAPWRAAKAESMLSLPQTIP